MIGTSASKGCLFCVGDEFVIDTREDVEALEASTCQGHRRALREVLFDMAVTLAARKGVPGFTLHEDVVDSGDGSDQR